MKKASLCTAFRTDLDWFRTVHIPAFNGWDARLQADANYYGESTGNNGTVVDRDSWSALNLRAGVLTERWEVTLFADNVTDERANTADNRSIAAEMPAPIVTNRPRTMGLEAATALKGERRTRRC